MLKDSHNTSESECQRCLRTNPVWIAPNELWNKVVQEEYHFLCPNCFILTAEEKGITPTAWVLQEETSMGSETPRSIAPVTAEQSVGVKTQGGNRQDKPTPMKLKSSQSALIESLIAEMPEPENYGNGFDDLIRKSVVTKLLKERLQ